VRPYSECCGRWHSGAFALLAPDAESLMRSRYSAYVLGLHDYLLATWHVSTRPQALEPDPPGLQWLGLEVRRQRVLAPAGASPETATHAEVEFVARHKQGGRAQRLHEISRFERDALGRWQYVDGSFVATGPGSAPSLAHRLAAPPPLSKRIS
jgi:SEC-C motif-containing protein